MLHKGKARDGQVTSRSRVFIKKLFASYSIDRENVGVNEPGTIIVHSYAELI